MIHEEVLLIHLGGLGDVCLSESLFLSISQHFGGRVAALGYKRFLSLFEVYFERIYQVDERRWLPFFSEMPGTGATWERIVLVGKDRSGALRRRCRHMSAEESIFVDMFPEEESVHVEAYQLAQMDAYGIEAIRKQVGQRPAERVILYPEKAYAKGKWPVEHFLALQQVLGSKNVEVVLLEAPDLSLPAADVCRFEQLSDTVRFFDAGGLFVSNDSGVAHLAGACGLVTITLFHDQDPRIWHPRGRNHPILCDSHSPSVEGLAEMVLKIWSVQRSTRNFEHNM